MRLRTVLANSAPQRPKREIEIVMFRLLPVSSFIFSFIIFLPSISCKKHLTLV